MIEATIYIPIVRNGNRGYHGGESWEEWQGYLADTFMGWTLLPGTTFGAWMDEHGRSVYDECRRYVVSSTHRELLVAAVDKAKALFDQRCIYVSFGKAEIL